MKMWIGEKKLLLTLVACLFTLVLQAQDQLTSGLTISAKERAMMITEEMRKEVRMDEEQRLAVRQTWMEFYTDMQALQQADHLRKSELRKSFKRVAETRDLKMKGILNEEQYIKYEHFLETIMSS